MLRLFSQNEMAAEKEVKDDKVQVFVWSGGLGSLGHVAVQLDGEKPKRNLSDRGKYLSIWPKNTPAGGLTSIFPLTAALCPNLAHDCVQEAAKPSDEFEDLMHPTESESKTVEPDKVYTFSHLDKEKIKQEVQRLESGIADGSVRYQLLPGVKLGGFFQNFLSRNQRKPEVYNCVTLTDHLLKVGGMHTLPESSAWVKPSKYADILSKQLHTPPSYRKKL